ncbi:MAG: hypothetical protein ABSB40_09465 [Nitrososphaeria archaeon]|jgi:hypothetical protein
MAEINKFEASEGFREFLEAFSLVIDSMGDYLIKMGEVEKKANVTITNMTEFLGDKANVEKIVQVMPPEMLALFLKIIFRASALNKTDPYKATPDEKITTGKQMKEIAKDAEELIKLWKEGPKE